MRVSESKLKGKYALITGASSGIGKGIVELFLKAGAFVCAISRNPDKLKHLKKEMGEQKENLLCFPCDISKSSEVSKALDQVKQQYPRLDVLVNNAGIMKAGTIMDVEEKDWDKMVNVNLKGYYLISKYSLPMMLDGKGGSIINISSILGVTGCKGLSVYAATKGGGFYVKIHGS